MESHDAGFSDALELMTFLANLVGSQHIERFIPLADTQSERWVANAAGKMTPTATEETREMPVAAVAESSDLAGRHHGHAARGPDVLDDGNSRNAAIQRRVDARGEAAGDHRTGHPCRTQRYIRR